MSDLESSGMEEEEEEEDDFTQETDIPADPRYATLVTIALITTNVCADHQREYLSDLCKAAMVSNVSSAILGEIAFDVGNYAAADLLFKLEWARYKGNNVTEDITDFYRRVLHYNHKREGERYHVETRLLSDINIPANVVNIATSFLYPGYRPGDLFTILQGTDFASSLEYPPNDS